MEIKGKGDSMKCDELKSFNCVDSDLQEFCEPRLVYPKSEADKVIAEKDKEITELKEKLKNSRNARKYWRKEYLIEYKECCNTKYKRCLALADYAEAESCYHATLANGFWLIRNDMKKRDDERRITKRWDKWQNRWLAIAEQFKEAK